MHYREKLISIYLYIYQTANIRGLVNNHDIDKWRIGWSFICVLYLRDWPFRREQYIYIYMLDILIDEGNTWRFGFNKHCYLHAMVNRVNYEIRISLLPIALICVKSGVVSKGTICELLGHYRHCPWFNAFMSLSVALKCSTICLDNRFMNVRPQVPLTFTPHKTQSFLSYPFNLSKTLMKLR